MPDLDIQDPFKRPTLDIADPFKGGPGFIAPTVTPPDFGTGTLDVIDPFKTPIPPTAPAPANLGERLLPRAPAIPPPAPPKPKPSLYGELGKGIVQGLYQLKEMGGGLTALAAEAIKLGVPVLEPITEPVKEFGIETVEAARKGMEPYQGAVPSYKNIENVSTALQYLSHGVGTLLPMVAMSALTGGVGAATGKTLARNYLNTIVPKLMASGVSKEVINQTIKNGLIKGLERGAMLGGFASSLGMEAGSITAEKVQEGQNIEPFRTMLGAIPAALLDVLPQFSLVQRTGILKRLGLSQAEIELAQEAAKGTKAGLIGRIAKESGKQFMMEAPTEAIQSVFENWAANKDLTSAESIDDFIDSFLIGGAGGAFFGALGGAFEKAGGKVEKREEPKPPAPGELPTPTPGAAPPPVAPPPPEIPTAPGAPPLPRQALATEQEYLQNIQKGRWLDFLAEKFNPPALSRLEEIQRDLGLIIQGNKVYGIDEKGNAIPLVPEQENEAKLEITKRLEQFMPQGRIHITPPPEGPRLLPIATPGEVSRAQNIFKFIGQLGPIEKKLLPVPSPTPPAKPPRIEPGKAAAPAPPAPAPTPAERRKVFFGKMGSIDIFFPDWKHGEFFDAPGRLVRQAGGEVTKPSRPAEDLKTWFPQMDTIFPGIQPHGVARMYVDYIKDRAKEALAKGEKQYKAPSFDEWIKGREVRPAAPAPGTIVPDLGEAGKAIVENLYAGLFGALQKGEKTFHGVEDPVLAKARPFYDAGLIKSPEDLKRIVNQNYLQDLLRAHIPEGAPEWLGIGKKVSFEGKGGASQTGTVKDVVYGPPDGKTPMGVTVETAAGKTVELKPDQVWEPRRLGRQREYRGEIATLPPEERRQVVKDSKEFDRLILANADLFEEQGMIDMMDTRELLDQLRHDVGQRFGINDPYSPIQRANWLPDLQDFMEKARPGSTEKIEVPKPKPFITPTKPKAPGPAIAPAPIARPAPAPPTPAPALPAAPAPEKIAALQAEKPAIAPATRGGVTLAEAKVSQRLDRAAAMRREAAQRQKVLKQAERTAAVIPITEVTPEIKGAPVELGQAQNERVRLQNEFLRIGDMGEAMAREHFATMTDENLRAMAKANVQPENIPRKELEKRMLKYSLRAAQNILHRAEIPEAPAIIIAKPGLPEEHQKVLLRPGQSYMAAVALRHINNALDIPPEDKMLGREILRKYRQETQNIPIKTLRPDMLSRSPGSAAYYNTGTGDIWLDPELMKKKTPGQAARTIFHETIHGIIERNMTPADRAELLEMIRLAKNTLSEAERKILDDPDTDITGRSKTYIAQGLVEQNPNVYYALSDPSEVFAQLAVPEVRDFFRSIPGIEKPVKRNLLERILDWANRILFGSENQHTRTLLADLFEKMGEIGERVSPEEIQKWNDQQRAIQEASDLKPLLPETRSILPEASAANLENADQYMAHRAASTPDFMKWIKNKVGYGYIDNKDLTVCEQNLSLPWHLRKKFPLYGLMVDDQLKREQNRSESIVQFKEATNAFLNLQDGPELLKVEKALIQGDKEKIVYDNDKLTNRFGLSDVGLEAYHSVRATLDMLLQRKLDHAEMMILRPYERTLNDAEFAQLQENYRKDLTDEERAALSPTVAKIIQKLQKPMNLIRQIRSDIQAYKGYFPREREKGAFYISVWVTENDAQGNPHEVPAYFGFKNTQRETMELVKKLKAEYPDAKVNYGRWTQEPESTYFGMSDMNLMRFIDNAIEKLKSGRQIDEPIQEGLRNALAQSVGEMLLGRGAGAHQIHRNPRLIEGYKTTGLKEVLMNYITGYMGAETKQEAAFDFMDSLQTVPKDQPVLFQEMAHYASSMLRNFESMDRSMSKARAFAAIWYLGGSVRSAVLNFTQNFVQGIPFLARIMKPLGKGPLAAERSYIKAMWDVAMGHGTEEENLMIHEMVTSGIANDQQIRQISREMRGGTPGVIGNVMDIMMSPFSLVEKFNRKSAALAAYRVYQELGLTGEELFQKTRDYVYDVHNLMTRANLPHAMRGGDLASQLLGTAYTFRRFNHNYILAMIYSLRGPDGKISLKNSDVLIRSLAWFAVLGGMTALPFLDDILDELEKFFGRPFRTEMRSTLRQIGGEPLEQLGVAGIPAMLGQVLPVGVDMSGSLRMGLPSITEPLKGAEETLMGVWGGLAKKTTGAYTQIGLGQYLRAFENASPIFIENILKATRMATEGATTPTGKQLFDVTGKPILETTAEAAAQTLGFRPERISLMARTHREFGNVELNFSGRRDELYARFRLAKDAEDRQKVILDVQEYNLDAAKFRGVIPMINAQALRQAILVKPEKKYMLFGSQFGQ